MISLFYLTASDDSESKEFRCLNISIKEIYSATNNLSASNFIGQGIAGEDLSINRYLRIVMTNKKDTGEIKNLQKTAEEYGIGTHMLYFQIQST